MWCQQGWAILYQPSTAAPHIQQSREGSWTWRREGQILKNPIFNHIIIKQKMGQRNSLCISRSLKADARRECVSQVMQVYLEVWRGSLALLSPWYRSSWPLEPCTISLWAPRSEASAPWSPQRRVHCRPRCCGAWGCRRSSFSTWQVKGGEFNNQGEELSFVGNLTILFLACPALTCSFTEGYRITWGLCGCLGRGAYSTANPCLLFLCTSPQNSNPLKLHKQENVNNSRHLSHLCV